MIMKRDILLFGALIESDRFIPGFGTTEDDEKLLKDALSKVYTVPDNASDELKEKTDDQIEEDMKALVIELREEITQYVKAPVMRDPTAEFGAYFKKPMPVLDPPTHAYRDKLPKVPCAELSQDWNPLDIDYSQLELRILASSLTTDTVHCIYYGKGCPNGDSFSCGGKACPDYKED